MDDLFAAIAVHLRRHNRRLERAPVERVWQETMRPLAPAPGCQCCGRAIMAGADPLTIGYLLRARRCLDCYMREAA
jgi:hypothetical protein